MSKIRDNAIRTFREHQNFVRPVRPEDRLRDAPSPSFKPIKLERRGSVVADINFSDPTAGRQYLYDSGPFNNPAA